MRKRRSITIRRGDHIGDPISTLFLAPEELAGSVEERVRAYLGEKVRVLSAMLSREQIDAEFECFQLSEEAGRLAEAAAGLARNRLFRSAEQALGEALKLDPLNARARQVLGEVYRAQERHSEALATLVRARELSGDDANLLTAMGACCIKLERKATAIGYLERALEIDPRHFRARRMLSRLGRKPPAASKPKRGASEPAAKTNLK